MAGSVDTALFTPIVMTWLALNFLSTMGENYFMDIIAINGSNAKDWLFIGDALSKVFAGAIQPTPGHNWKDQDFKLAIIPSLIDATGKIFIFRGIAMSSAQARAILGTSTTVWAALFSYFSLGRVVSGVQWAGIGTIIFGMYIKKDWSKAFNEGDQVVLGYLFILIGMAFHVGSGVLVEFFSRKRSFPAPKLGCLMGLINLTVWYFQPILFAMFSEGWQGMKQKAQKDFHSLPFDDGKGYFFGMGTGLAFFTYFGFSTLHYSAYFNLMGTAGLVTITAQKSLVTAGYVALSAIAFCNASDSNMSEYCPSHKWLWVPPFVQGTVVSALACLTGVIVYSYGTHLKDVRDAREPQVRDERITTLVESSSKATCASQVEMKGTSSSDTISR